MQPYAKKTNWHNNELVLNCCKLIKNVTTAKIKHIGTNNESRTISDITSTGTSQPGPQLFNQTIHIITKLQIAIPVVDFITLKSLSYNISFA